MMKSLMEIMKMSLNNYLLYINDGVHRIELDLNLLQLCGLNSLEQINFRLKT